MTYKGWYAIKNPTNQPTNQPEQYHSWNEREEISI